MEERSFLYFEVHDVIFPLIRREVEFGRSESEIIYEVLLAAEDCCKKLRSAKTIRRNMSASRGCSKFPHRAYIKCVPAVHKKAEM